MAPEVSRVGAAPSVGGDPITAWRAPVDGLRLTPVNLKTHPILSLAALLVSGCGNDLNDDTVEPRPTIIELSPRDFLGSLTCGAAAGELQRYVATLTDVSPIDSNEAGGDGSRAIDVPLPSSLPLPCEQGVGFGRVVAGHFYVATIDGYDRSDLQPLAPGTPILIGPDKKPVAPRWSTSCGTRCPYENKACPPEPLPPNAAETGYPFAVRAESELIRRLQPCWAWQLR